jgi:hypothetical protein
MTDYCEVDDDVKPILQIETTTTSFDAELAACIVTANALVDGILKKSGLTVPASVPQLVKDGAAHFAAWLFRRRRDPTGAEAFWVEANRLLDAYVASEAKTDKPLVVSN